MKNLKFGDEFNSIKFRAKHVYGAKDLDYSGRKDKKYVVTLKNGEKIHFGDRQYEDFLVHKDPERRIRYRKRASKIKNRYGKLTYKDPRYANYWSYHLLW